MVGFYFVVDPDPDQDKENDPVVDHIDLIKTDPDHKLGITPDIELIFDQVPDFDFCFNFLQHLNFFDAFIDWILLYFEEDLDHDHDLDPDPDHDLDPDLDLDNDHDTLRHLNFLDGFICWILL